jgi:hypothetical protein
MLALWCPDFPLHGNQRPPRSGHPPTFHPKYLSLTLRWQLRSLFRRENLRLTIHRSFALHKIIPMNLLKPLLPNDRENQSGRPIFCSPTCRHRALFLTLLAFLVSSIPLSAQDQAANVVVDADVARGSLLNRVATSALTTQAGFAAPSPGDPDLGEQLLLTRNERYRSLSLFGSVDEFFTTNAFLTRNNVRSDWFTAMQAGALWLPHISGNLYGQATVRQQLFRYARFSELSFNSTELGAGLIYVFRQLGDLSLSGGYVYNLLTNASSTQEIFHEQVLRFSLQKPFVLSRAHYLYTGLTADVVLAGQPEYALRHRFYGFAGYQVALTRMLSANVFYQIGYLPFLENQRSDWNQIISGSLVLSPTNWFSVSTSLNAAFNASNDSFFEYNVLNVGVGVNALFRF